MLAQNNVVSAVSCLNGFCTTNYTLPYTVVFLHCCKFPFNDKTVYASAKGCCSNIFSFEEHKKDFIPLTSFCHMLFCF